MFKKYSGLVAMLTAMILALPTVGFAQDKLEGKFSPEMLKFINEFQVKVHPTNVEVYSSFCSPDHPNYRATMDPDERARDCVAQYAGPEAVELQKLRAEKLMADTLATKQAAKIAELEKQLAALKSKHETQTKKLVSEFKRSQTHIESAQNTFVLEISENIKSAALISLMAILIGVLILLIFYQYLRAKKYRESLGVQRDREYLNSRLALQDQKATDKKVDLPVDPNAPSNISTDVTDLPIPDRPCCQLHNTAYRTKNVPDPPPSK